MNSIEKILTDADTSLTKENWIKGNYFALAQDNTICMCPHGAVQRQTNPKIQKMLSLPQERHFRSISCVLGRDPAFAASLGNCMMSVAKDVFEAWSFIPANKKDLKVHYLMGMSGLTSQFNDSPNTTFEMMKDKFKQAIEMAKKLGV